MRREAEVRQLPAPPRLSDDSAPTLRPSQNACYEALSLALKEGQVFAALTGPAGSGKTTVLEAVLADRRDRALRCIRITDPDKVPASLATQIEQVAYSEAGKPENMGRHVVLAVDDAHLSSADLLLCLSRLAAMREPGRRVPQILLSGRPELWDRLSVEEFEPLARRLAIRAALPALEDDDDDPWAIVEDEITQTMAQLRADAETPLALREEYDEASEREALFGSSYGYAGASAGAGTPGSPAAQAYEDEEEEVPPPSVFALFPDPPPRADRSSARETRRRLLMPLVSLFVGLASFAFALSFYDWPDLVGDLPWSETKKTEPFVMPRSPQERTFGLPMLPPNTTQSASPPLPQALTPRPSASSAPAASAPRATPATPVTPAVTARSESAPVVANTPPPVAPIMAPAPVAEAPTATAEPPPSARAPVQAPVATVPVVQAPTAQAPIGQAPVVQAPVVQVPAAQAPAASSPTPPAVQQALVQPPATPAPTAPVATPRPAVVAPPRVAEAPLAPALVALLLRRGDEQTAIGDISAARLLYERAAESGSGLAARQLARTYDSAFLPSAVEGSLADAARARRWYERAAALGNADAAARLKSLNQGR